MFNYDGLTWYTVFCVLCYLQGAILFGLDTGSFGAIQALPSWLRDFGTLNAQGKYHLEPTRASLMNSLPWIGKFAGCFTSEQIIDRIGYKKTALVANIIQFVGVILEMTSKEWIQFTMGRMITYYAVGLCENMVPAYNAEIAPSRHRGLLAGSIICFSGAGNLWGAGMGQAFKTTTTKEGWLVPVAMQLIPALLMITLVPFTPESPRWLLNKGRAEEAQRNLNRLRTKEEVASGASTEECQLLGQLIEEAKESEAASWSRIWRGNIPKRIWITCTLFIISQMNGNQFVQSYAPTFYKQQGLGANAFLYNVLGQAVGLIGGLIGLFLLDITGRRPLFLGGSVMVFFLLYLAGGLGLDSSRNHARAMTIVACFILLKPFTRISAGNNAFLTGAEIGGTQYRKKIMALGTSCDVVAAFLVTFVTPYILPSLGVNISWIFGSVAAFGFVWGYFFFPELKGRSLEEVDEMFEKGLWGFQFKSYVSTGKAAQLRNIEDGNGQTIERVDDVKKGDFELEHDETAAQRV